MVPYAVGLAIGVTLALVQRYAQRVVRQEREQMQNRWHVND